MNIIWEPVPGYTDTYEINNIGTVRSISGRYKGKILDYQTNTSGYFRVRLHSCGKAQFHFVHRLVALVFVSRGNADNLFVNHKNGNKKDNSAENLEWCTRSVNSIHSYRQLNRKAAWSGKSGYDHHRSKEVIAKHLVTKEVRVFGSIRHAAIGLDVSDSNIVSVLKGRRTNCKGWSFEYASSSLGLVIPAPNTQPQLFGA